MKDFAFIHEDSKMYINSFLDPYSRYQKRLTISHLFPIRENICACGCGNILEKPRKKWFSDKCRDNAFIEFSIVKGDIKIVREQLYLRDRGTCKICGVIEDNWQADHLCEVRFGGGACGLSNFQTLCLSCHQEKSYNAAHQRTISSQAA